MRPETITVIRASGKISKVPYPSTDAGWRRILGGPVEVIQSDRSELVLGNEDAILLDLPTNETAMAMLGKNFVVGSVVVVRGSALKRWRREASCTAT